MNNKQILIIFTTILYISSLWLLWLVNWKIAVGVFLFGFATNLDNELRKYR